MFVIKRNIEGIDHFYGGYISEYSPNAFSESGVQWNKTKTRYTRFDGDMADKIMKQLTDLGFTDCEKVVLFEKRKKAA